jgi:hypothetical protein
MQKNFKFSLLKHEGVKTEGIVDCFTVVRFTLLCLLPASYWLIFDFEGGGIMLLQNISEMLPDYMVLHPTRKYAYSSVLFTFSLPFLF